VITRGIDATILAAAGAVPSSRSVTATCAGGSFHISPGTDRVIPAVKKEGLLDD
jgi:hypothetical protein